MTDSTPEHYLAAARIAYPDGDWDLQGGRPIDAIEETVVGFDLSYGDDYRALREALDKKYEIHIKWSQSEQNWFSLPSLKHMADRLMDPMSDDNITNLMMRNVVALVEAGVVE